MKIVPIAPKRRYANADRGQAMARKFANYSKRVAFSGENLIISISNTLAIHNQNVRDAKTLIGRFIGLFSKSVDPENVKIDGTRLQQLFELTQTEPPIKLSGNLEYHVDLTSLSNMLSKAKEQLAS